MTGGQFSPTSPMGTRAATAPYGNLDPSFDLCKLCIAAGATYVARGHVGNGVFLEKIIRGGMQHKGFAVIEVMANCHTQYGRRNKHPDPAELIEYITAHAVALSKWDTLSAEEQEGKFPVGVLHKDTTKPEYCDQYANLQRHAIEKARAAVKKIAEAESLHPKSPSLGAQTDEN
jgi:2-oxoglutarate ferredoxin oxidoreductase subunit beta